jgi:hypothetical protein
MKNIFILQEKGIHFAINPFTVLIATQAGPLSLSLYLTWYQFLKANSVLLLV